MATEKMIDRIRALLEKAARTDFEGERNALLDKADALMRKHQIDEALLDATRPVEERAATAFVNFTWSWFKFQGDRQTILAAVAEHYRCHVAYHGSGRFTIAGVEHNVEMTQMFYTMIELELVRKIEPSWDRSISFDANVKALQEAGKKWVDIAFLANANGGNPRTGQPGSTKDGNWLKAAYRRECARLGEEPRRQTQRHEAWRNSFASAFRSKILARLRDMEKATGEPEKGGGAELALLTSDEKVRNDFYAKFPDLHPDVQREKYRRYREEADARFAALSPEEQRRYLREEERQRRASDSYWNRQYDDAGWKAGDHAAAQVDLSGGKNHVPTTSGRELE